MELAMFVTSVAMAFVGGYGFGRARDRIVEDIVKLQEAVTSGNRVMVQSLFKNKLVRPEDIEEEEKRYEERLNDNARAMIG